MKQLENVTDITAYEVKYEALDPLYRGDPWRVEEIPDSATRGVVITLPPEAVGIPTLGETIKFSFGGGVDPRVFKIGPVLCDDPKTKTLIYIYDLVEDAGDADWVADISPLIKIGRWDNE